MYVQLLTAKHIDVDGIQKRFMPGDWVEIKNKLLVQRMISNGEARTFDKNALALDPGCGIFVRGDLNAAQPMLAKLGETVPSTSGNLRLDYARTLIWEPPTPLHLDLVHAGFHILKNWQAAAPLYSYDKLAKDIGMPEDRERTQSVIHDLRVPVYDTNPLFLRRCEDTERLLAVWQEEKQYGDERLAFMRACYQVKPLIMALPTTWRE